MSGAFYEADHFLILNSALGRGKHPRRDGFQMQCPKIEYRHLSVLKQPTFSVLPKTRLIFSGSHAQGHRKASQNCQQLNREHEELQNISSSFCHPNPYCSMVIFHAYSRFCLHRACHVWEKYSSIKSWSSERTELVPRPKYKPCTPGNSYFPLKTCSFLRWWHSKYTMLQTHILPIWFSVIDEFEYLL